ncbi:hypothetical protein SK355_02830 [Candidatus Fukatsuia symbiotica]|uniref:Uncharacterized protein n=1 Tax=Candidatus Fukatsuia symbiotica TaxID=1878942 RepID=A0A2U8I2N8_9GAMM|nr:hypothetical protein [Candidatus Fukatsuia symbiotica]AWK13377.1 hypothetical protein CCS41_00910 [Candidatus Fukatsuia symbiotica]MEA9444267.1 hypothetical protein [Candidatus Fukatsuia symbiotica]
MKYKACDDRDVAELPVKPFYDDLQVDSLNIHFNHAEIEERKSNKLIAIKQVFNSHAIKASRMINPGCGSGYASNLATCLNLDYLGMDFSSQ